MKQLQTHLINLLSLIKWHYKPIMASGAKKKKKVEKWFNAVAK